MSSFAFIPDIAPATYADLEKLRPDQRGEIIFGELCMTPRPAFAHMHVVSVVGARLMGEFQFKSPSGAGGSWIFVHEPELRIGGDAIIPDIAAWRTERHEQIVGDYPSIAPDWVCEILSPSTAKRDWTSKADWYLQNGVQWYWIVDPRKKFVQCFKAGASQWEPVGEAAESAHANLDPFSELSLNIGEFWLN